MTGAEEFIAYHSRMIPAAGLPWLVGTEVNLNVGIFIF